MNLNQAYLLHGSKAFIPVIEGPKYYQGLVIEADGWHAQRVPVNERVREAEYKGQAYTPHRLRAHVRRWKPATAGARALVKRFLRETEQGKVL